jgi:dipeptidyl aminopeptidase/acylaminoacyl peptidase
MPSSNALTANDILGLKSLSDAQVDPTGARVAFVVAETFIAYKQPTAESRIWLAEVAGGTSVQITQGPGADDLPRWSPDGAMLAFRSDREKRGTGQIYLLRGGWQEATLLHRFPSGVSAIHWSPDGRQIAAIVSDTPRDGASHAEGDDRVLFEEEHPFGRIWIIEIASGEARCVMPGQMHVWELAWAPDGRSIAAIVSDLPYGWSWYRPRLARIDVASGEARTLYAPERQIARPVWSPDSNAIAVISSTWSDPGMTGGDLFLVPADGGAARDLTEDRPISHLAAQWLPNGHTLRTAALERNRAAICEVGIDGESETLWAEERGFIGNSISASADGNVVAAILAGNGQPAELWVGQIASSGARGVRWEQCSAVNADFDAAALPNIETITWQAADGTPVDGLLLRPHGTHIGPVPLVVLIHGGPTSSWPYGFRGGGLGGCIPLLAARRIAVLLPNPRGSIGSGLAFAEANHGDMGGEDLADILAGVDYCVREGIADPERLGVGGWSYGGYMTAWAITQTDRFKAAVAGASITNWYSFHGGTNIPAFDEIFYGTNPYALDGPYATRSPIFLIDKVRTPTLFLHGERDACCPSVRHTK